MLTIRNIHKTFGDHTILHGIDLDIAKGSVVVILGPSGSGNSLLFRRYFAFKAVVQIKTFAAARQRLQIARTAAVIGQHAHNQGGIVLRHGRD